MKLEICPCCGRPKKPSGWGDSRNFAALVAGAAGLVTSPPYADARTIASGVQQNEAGWRTGTDLSAGKSKGYGAAPGQLSALPTGDADAVLTSPPWQDGLGRDTVTKSERVRYARDHGIANAEHVTPIDIGHARQDGYGTTPGQVGRLKEGDVDSVVTSPPWEDQEPSHGQRQSFSPPHDTTRNLIDSEYSTAPGQVGALCQETYWDAVKCIYGQCLLALKPGGVMAVVVKPFVRRKRLVDLPGQTWRLLLSLGFLPVQRIRCLLTEETREPSLFGGDCTRKKSRESFFRRLATKKGAPEIGFEEILCVRKPGGAA